MKKAVIIGGGEIGRKGTEYETQKIDKEIVALANKQSPNFLFLGFANVNHIESYFRVIKRNYRNLGCISKTILKKELDNRELILERFNNADIIYSKMQQFAMDLLYYGRLAAQNLIEKEQEDIEIER